MPLAKKSACAPMCFEFVLLSNMSGDDLRRTLGNAIYRIARISNDKLGQILAVNPENQRESENPSAVEIPHGINSRLSQIKLPAI